MNLEVIHKLIMVMVKNQNLNQCNDISLLLKKENLCILFGIFFTLTSFLPYSHAENENLVPDWIQNTALWYGQNLVSETEFLNAIEFLITNGIIDVGFNEESLVMNSFEKIEDNGDFFVTYYPNPNSTYEISAKQWVQDSFYFEQQVEYLNSLFKLPYDVEIVLDECFESNAFYDPQLKQVIMCYEFIDSVYDDFEFVYGDTSTDDEISIMAFDVMDFVFYHEIGHALVDVYLLPITGLEENAVDQFAALIMMSTENEEQYDGILGQDILFNVGNWFAIQDDKQFEPVYWGVHNLDIQRYYNILCYAYGQNPEYNQDLIEQNWLPMERALNCEYEYAVMADSWSRLLDPFYI